MEYPVIISGEKVGKLTVRTEGLFTVFEAETAALSGVRRLWVFGDGRWAYLGVLQPWRGGAYLKRKLSRGALRGFPERIEYAGDKAGEGSAPVPAEPEPKSRQKTEPRPKTGPKPKPKAEPAGEQDLLWFAAPSGVLTAFDGVHSLTAIPAKLRRRSDGADVRIIDGQEYIVFRKS